MFKGQIQSIDIPTKSKRKCWSAKEMVVERIEPNENMESKILSKSKAVFINVNLPKITRILTSRQISSKKILTPKETHLQKTRKIQFKDVQKNEKYPEAGQNNQEEKISSHKGYQQPINLCICMKRCNETSGQVVICDSENSLYGILHFDRVNIKRKPKPQYYCPGCRKLLSE